MRAKEFGNTIYQTSYRGSVCETEQTSRKNVQLVIRSNENEAKRKFKIVIDFSFYFMSHASSLWTIYTPISRHHRRVSGCRLYRTLGTRKYSPAAKPWSQHLQTASRLTLKYCYLYNGLSRNSLLFHFLVSFLFVPTCCRLDFRRFLESGLRSSQAGCASDKACLWRKFII